MLFLNKKLASLLKYEDKKKLPFLISIVTFGGFVEILSLGILIPISSIVLNNTLIQDNYIFDKIFSSLNLTLNENLFEILILFFVGSYLIKILLLIYTNWYQAVYCFNFNKKLSNHFYQNYLNKNYFSLNDLSSSEFIRNSILEIDKLTEFLINNLRLITEVITFSIITIFLFVYNFLPTLIVSLLILFFLFFYYIILRSKILKIGLTKQKFENKKIQFLNSAFGGIKDIKMSFSENYFFGKFNQFNSIIAEVMGKNALYNILPRYLLEFILVVLLFIYLSFVKFTGLNFDSLSVALPIYLLAFIRLFPSANKIIASLQSMRLNKPSLNVVFKKIKEYQALSKKKNEISKKIFLKKLININIKKFKYKSDSSFELKNIKIAIKKGERVGIIGPTGSGKSTIVELLINILYLRHGDITLDNNSTRNFVNSWRSIIGYIPQKIYILEDSLKNNICLNDKYKNYQDKYFINILQQVGLGNWYKKLPKGLNTNLSERGINLSGGEIQRLGIARALVHNPEILILDEATSSLDSFTEKQILKNIFKLKGKTLISISHRLETLKNFNKIFLIKNGKLIASKKSINSFKNI